VQQLKNSIGRRFAIMAAAQDFPQRDINFCKSVSVPRLSYEMGARWFINSASQDQRIENHPSKIFELHFLLKLFQIRSLQKAGFCSLICSNASKLRLNFA
jgi:hypothetical protein